MTCLVRATACRTASAAVVLLLGVALLPSIADASSVGGRTIGTESVASAVWGMTASVTSMTFTANTSQLSEVTNNGNVPLVAESFVVTVPKSPGNPSFTVFLCPVPWVSTTCSGGPGTQVGGTLTKNSTSTITTSTALAVGGIAHLQVRPTAVAFSITVTLIPQITSPGQVRAAVATNQ